MIVRILGEGQYRLDSIYLERLNDVDNQLVAQVDSGGEARFRELFEGMLAMVREHGQEVPLEELVTSDVVLPDPSSHLDEIKALFVGEGVIPG